MGVKMNNVSQHFHQWIAFFLWSNQVPASNEQQEEKQQRQQKQKQQLDITASSNSRLTVGRAFAESAKK